MGKAHRGYPEGFDPENPECPECGGAMYDNRDDKASGERSPKSPDFGCKDRDGCDTGIWPERKGAQRGGGRRGGGNNRKGWQRDRDNRDEQEQEPAPAAAPAPRPVVNHYTPAEARAVRMALTDDYFALMQTVKDRMTVIALGKPEAMVALDMGNVQAATFSLFGFMKAAKVTRDPAAIAVAYRKAQNGTNGKAPGRPQPAKEPVESQPLHPRARTEVPGEGPPARAPQDEASHQRAVAESNRNKAIAAGRPAMIDTRTPAERAKDGYEEFPTAFENEDDDLPF